MRHIAFIAGILLCGVNACAFTLREAMDIYRQKFADSPPSMQESGEYCFLIVEGSLADATKGNIRPLVLAGEMKLLSKHIDGVGLGYKTPFCPEVMKLLASKAGFEIPTCKSVTVENSQSGDWFRHVSAYEAGPIRIARERAARREKGRRSAESWCRDLEMLARKYENAKSSTYVWMKVGASIPVIRSECKTLPCVGVPVNAAAVERLVRTWNPDDANKASCEQALAILPTFSLAHMRLGDIEESKGNWLSASMEALYAGVAGEFDAEKFSRRVSAFSKHVQNPAWDELNDLVRRVANRSSTSDSKALPFLGELCRGAGFLYFSDADDGDAERQFERARSLFLEGKDLALAISLLEQSLAKNPGRGEVWRYYASALRTGGRIEEAVLAGHEAIALDDGDYVAAWDVVRCYRLMGFNRLAAGNAWWLAVSSGDDEIRRKALSLLKEIFPDVFE